MPAPGVQIAYCTNLNTTTANVMPAIQPHGNLENTPPAVKSREVGLAGISVYDGNQ
jgi:hypothetical protein